MPAGHTFVAKQPILDLSGRVVAYELLFRSGFQPSALIEDGVTSTLSVLEASLVGHGLDKLAADKDCYLNCTDELLRSPFLCVMPPHRFVLEILETCTLTEGLGATCRRLRQSGFRIALDDVCSYVPEMAEVLPAVDIVKLDWLFIDPIERASLCQMFSGMGKTVLAEKIEDWSAFHAAREAGATLFQGYFFSRPEIHQARRVAPDFQAVLAVMQLLLEDVPHNRIIAALEKVPSLVVHLLRLTSCAALNRNAKSQPVNSIGSALNIVGTENLLQWCALLLYVNRLPLGEDPFAQQAQQRSQIMARYVEHRYAGERSLLSHARLTGALSLLHVTYSSDAAEFWKGLPLAPEIVSAIVTGDGHLGEALAFAISVESGEFPN